MLRLAARDFNSWAAKKVSEKAKKNKKQTGAIMDERSCAHPHAHARTAQKCPRGTLVKKQTSSPQSHIDLRSCSAFQAGAELDGG